MEAFRYWCYKVLPLVYDDSLSYYETLCKVVKYINELIAQDKIIGNDLTDIKNDINTIQKWIDDFDTSYAEKIIADYIATMVFFGLTDSGYFVAYIPENWKSIQFNTTGVYIDVAIQPEYGHLVLSY